MLLSPCKAMIHGYHTYREIWSDLMNEKLPCEKEFSDVVTVAKIFLQVLIFAQFECLKYAKICTI